MSQVDSLRFRHQAEHLSVAVEDPWSASFADLEGGFAIPIKEYNGRLSSWVLVREFDSRRSVPFDVDHRNKAVRQDSLDGRPSFKILKLRH